MRARARVHHVTSVGYFHIRQLRLLRRSLMFDAAHTLLRAMIHSRLDYCNSIMANAPLDLLNCLHCSPWYARLLVSSCGFRRELVCGRQCSNASHSNFTPCMAHGIVHLSRMCSAVAPVMPCAALRSATSCRLLIPRIPGCRLSGGVVSTALALQLGTFSRLS